MSPMTTLFEPTAITEEQDTVPQSNPSTIRVSIREIREYTYRALIVAGASPGEAATAASQVLHAELHNSQGLTGLVSDLSRGPWPRSGLTCTRRRGPQLVLEVDCGTRSGELRVGAPLLDLVAGQWEPATATTAAEVPLTSLLDEVLLAAAKMINTSVTAMHTTPSGPYAARHATAEGNLGHGHLDRAHLLNLSGVGRLGALGAFVVVTGEAAQPALSQLTWSTRSERAERRREAAKLGVAVDASTWQVVADHAYRFLVPEVDS